MNKKLEFKYPKLSDVLDSLESDATSFDYSTTVLEGNESDDDEIFTFETHPFYSQVGDLEELEILDSDIY